MKYALTIIAVSLLTLSCTEKQKETDLNIITTTNFVSEAVTQIAGDKLEITNLMKYGQDPHSFEPSPRDIAAVETADLIFVNGFGLEEGLLKILESVNNGEIIELSSTVDPIEHDDDQGLQEDNHVHEIDPHTWMSPRNMMKWIEIVTESLIDISPEHSSYFEENRKNYTLELEELHKEISEKVQTLEEDEKILITDHDSLAYYARDYGFSIEGTIIPGTSSNSDTSTTALIDLIKQLRLSRISTIFVGDTSGPDMVKMAESIQEELNYPIKIVRLKTGSLGKKGSETDNYIKYLTYNTDVIVNALKDDK